MTIRGTLSSAVRLTVFGNNKKTEQANIGPSEVITYRLSEEELEKYRSLPKPSRKSS